MRAWLLGQPETQRHAAQLNSFTTQSTYDRELTFYRVTDGYGNMGYFDGILTGLEV